MAKRCGACQTIEFTPVDSGEGNGTIVPMWICVLCGRAFVPDGSFKEKMSALIDTWPPDVEQTLIENKQFRDICQRIDAYWERNPQTATTLLMSTLQAALAPGPEKEEKGK